MESYVVYYDGEMDVPSKGKIPIKGYYAAKQPNYDWSFTEDITKALFYKTKIAAFRQKSKCGLRDSAKIFKVNVITTVEVIDEIIKWE